MPWGNVVFRAQTGILKIWPWLNKMEDAKDTDTDIRSGWSWWGGMCYNKAVTCFLSCLNLAKISGVSPFLLPSTLAPQLKRNDTEYSSQLLLHSLDLPTWNKHLPTELFWPSGLIQITGIQILKHHKTNVTY